VLLFLPLTTYMFYWV